MDEFERRLRQGMHDVVARAPRPGDALAAKIERRSSQRRRSRHVLQASFAAVLVVAVGLGVWTLEHPSPSEPEVAATTTAAQVGLHHAYVGTSEGVVHVNLATGATETLLPASSDEFGVVVGLGNWVVALVDQVAYAIDATNPSGPTQLGTADEIVASDVAGRVWLATDQQSGRTAFQELDLATRTPITQGVVLSGYDVVGSNKDGLLFEREGDDGVYQWTPSEPRPRLITASSRYLASKGPWIATVRAGKCYGVGPDCPVELTNLDLGTTTAVPIPTQDLLRGVRAAFSPDGEQLALVIANVNAAGGRNNPDVPRKFATVALIQSSTGGLSVVKGADLYIEPLGPLAWSPDSSALVYSEAVRRQREDVARGLPNPVGTLRMAGVRLGDGALVVIPSQLSDEFNFLAVL